MSFRSWAKNLFPAVGGALGSALLPGVGTALGGAAGGLLGSMFNRPPSRRDYRPMQGNIPYGSESIPSYTLPGGERAVAMPSQTPQQTSAMSQMLQQGLQGLGNLPTADFEPVKKAYENYYHQQYIPQIMEQFGGSGGLRSSAFEQALGSAGTGLSQNLASMQQQFNMQNRQAELAKLMSLLQFGMQPQFDWRYLPPEQSFGKSLMQASGPFLAGAFKYGTSYLPQLFQHKWPSIFNKPNMNDKPLIEPEV